MAFYFLFEMCFFGTNNMNGRHWSCHRAIFFVKSIFCFLLFVYCLVRSSRIVAHFWHQSILSSSIYIRVFFSVRVIVVCEVNTVNIFLSSRLMWNDPRIYETKKKWFRVCDISVIAHRHRREKWENRILNAWLTTAAITPSPNNKTSKKQSSIANRNRKNSNRNSWK